MPPHSTSNFVAMPGGKLMTTQPATPPREGELQSPVATGDRKAQWKSSFKKNSSKITPKERSPKQAPTTTTMTTTKKSKSGTTTPTKEPPLKSCLKKPSDGSQKSVASSPQLSHRSDFTQVSPRSEFTESVFDNSLSASLFHDDDEGAAPTNMLEPDGTATHDDHNPDDTLWPAPPSTAAESVVDGQQYLLDLDMTTDKPPASRRKEIPVAFIDAFARDEDAVADSPHMGPYLIKLAKSYASGADNPVQALEYCTRAVKFYDKHADRENALDLVISLHILAVLHCQLGQYEDAVAVLQRSLKIPDVAHGGEEHALAAFSGHMQLGDTLSMVGKQAASLEAYHAALRLQKAVLGDFHVRVAETCNYVAEAHVQAMEFVEAEQLCAHSLVIHIEYCEPRSLEEAADRRLLAIIYSAQGQHGKALDSLVYANDIFVNFEQEIDVATGNQSIGDELLALGRDAEALLCFEKCVNDYKTLRGEHNALVASASTSLAELYLRTNRPREAKAHCQNVLHIYAKQGVGHIPSDIAYGLLDIAAILEQLNEKETALLLLQRAYNILDKMPGQQATVSGIEAQIGILQYMTSQFKPALQSFQSVVAKMRDGTLRNSPLLGLVLNQMGLTAIELGDIQRAAGFFEDAKGVMEGTAGPRHLDTLDVCNNLACTYNALGRVEEARVLLEEVVQAKEEKLGAVHPDVAEDRARLQDLLTQVGHTTTHKKSRKLVELLTSARKAFHTSK